MKYYIIQQLNHGSVFSKSYHTMGFFAKFSDYFLENILRMEARMKETDEELMPYVDFQSRPSTLHDHTNQKIKNEWEYVFLQPKREEVFNSDYIMNDATFYAGDYPDGQPKPTVRIRCQEKNWNRKETISELSRLIEKYVKIRPDVLDKTNKEILKHKTLAVHCRRSEFHLLAANVALQYENETYFDKVMKIFNEGDCEKIYLATEESEIVNYFKERIPDKLIYQDCYRILRHESPFQGAFKGLPRDKHFTLHAQEVFIDAYNMSKCDSLMCGISNVSNGALYMNGRKYNNLYYFDEIEL